MRCRKHSFVAAAMTISCLALGSGCLEMEDEMTLTGRIVYIVSNYVEEYDLVSGERRELYRDDFSLDSPITAVDRTSFIVGGGRVDDSAGMLLVDGDGQAHQLGTGYNQVYFPAHGKLLYLSIPPGQSDIRLHEAALRENRLVSPRVVGDVPISPHPMLLAMSADELLVKRDRGPYMRYDLRTGLFVDLPIEKCWATAWRSRTQEVICLDISTKDRETVLVGLDGRKRSVQGLAELSVAAYVPQGDYVLAGRPRWSWTRGGEVTDLFSYDFSSGTVRRIAKEVLVGSRNAYWSPTRRGVE